MSAVLKFEKPRVSPTQIAKVQEYRRIKAEIDKLESVKKWLKESIVDLMQEDTQIRDYDGTVIAKRIEKTRTSVDQKKLKDMYNDAYEACLKSTSYSELRIS